jgi:hypothetical protein
MMKGLAVLFLFVSSRLFCQATAVNCIRERLARPVGALAQPFIVREADRYRAILETNGQGDEAGKSSC